MGFRHKDHDDAPELLISHNGISVPTLFTTPDFGSDHVSLDLRPTGLASKSMGIIALRDRLRPNLSISREYLQSLPWELFSAGDLALSRAISTLGDRTKAWPLSSLLSSERLTEFLTLGRLLGDPLLAQNGPWADENIFDVGGDDKYRHFVSLREIYAAIDGGDELTFNSLPSPGAFFDGEVYEAPNGVEVCAAVLATANLQLQFESGDYFSSRIKPLGRRLDPITEGENLFPPLTFMQFRNRGILRGEHPTLNIEHPFSQWLIENSAILTERYPGIFELIRKSILQSDYRWEPEDLIKEVHGALERLSELDPTLRPARAATPTLSDLDSR
jgi:hypothetical protein